MYKQEPPACRPFQKGIVIGCSGAGKSTFSRKLCAVTDLPLYYLDMLWHKADRTTVTREEFDRELKKLLAGECWILDGNYLRTLEMRLLECDAVFLFDLPLRDCLAGVNARIGHKRVDMPWIEEKFDEEFKQWILDFPKEKLPRIYELLKKHREGRQIIIFRSREEADRYIESLSKIL